MSSLSNLYTQRHFSHAQALQHPHSDIRRQAENGRDICDIHIRKYLQVTLQHCLRYALRVGLTECGRRTQVAEGLSIGIERLVLRSYPCFHAAMEDAQA